MYPAGVMKVEENWSVWFLWNFMYPGHENWRKSKHLIFVDFHVPGVIKIKENQSVWFLWIFMYLGSWKLKKIEVSDFCEFSCTRGHESWITLKLLIFVMKVEENWIVWFLWISCTQGHESWRKSKRLIFVDFHVTGVPSF